MLLYHCFMIISSILWKIIIFIMIYTFIFILTVDPFSFF